MHSDAVVRTEQGDVVDDQRQFHMVWRMVGEFDVLYAQGGFAVAVGKWLFDFRQGMAAVHDVCGEVRRKTLRFTHEGEDLRIGGRGVELLRVSVLRNRAVAHHYDAVSEIKCFFAVVGDENTGEAQLALQTFQLLTQILAHLHVQRAERFVEEGNFRRGGQRPCQRYPLLLPAGQLRRVTAAEGSELHHFQ